MDEEHQVQQRLRAVFGESWRSKKHRLLGDRLDARTYGGGADDDSDSGSSSEGSADEWPLWDVRSFIVKTNDDLRQEVCCLQCLELFKEVFLDVGLGEDLWLQSYRVAATGASSGLVQVIPDTLSLDALKKTPGFTTLAAYLRQTYSPGMRVPCALC